MKRVILLVLLCIKYSSSLPNELSKITIKSDCDYQKLCLNKCCSGLKFLNEIEEHEYHCIDVDFNGSYSKFPMYSNGMETKKYLDKSKFQLLDGNVNGTFFIDYPSGNGFEKFLSEDESGMLLFMSNRYPLWSIINSSNFCVDYIILNDSRNAVEAFLLQTKFEEVESTNPVFDCLITVCFFLSAVFLALVLVVYTMLSELRTIGGLILMAYVGCFLAVFLLHGIYKVMLDYEEFVTSTFCQGFSLAIYFFLLSSFFWMNIMSFDIWWTFRGWAMARPIHRRGVVHKFMMYSIYAFLPSILMTIAIHFLSRADMSSIPWFIKPYTQCFWDRPTMILYLYTPMLLLILANIMFFLMTACAVSSLRTGNAVLKSSAPSADAYRRQKHRLGVYIKLSIVMGVTWLLEIISFLFPNYYLFLLPDLYNALNGIAIFVVFVCKKKIFYMLKDKCMTWTGKKLGRQSWYHSKSSKSRTSSSSDDIMADISLVSCHPNAVKLL